jgi:hypothetical protein
MKLNFYLHRPALVLLYIVLGCATSYATTSSTDDRRKIFDTALVIYEHSFPVDPPRLYCKNTTPPPKSVILKFILVQTHDSLHKSSPELVVFQNNDPDQDLYAPPPKKKPAPQWYWARYIHEKPPELADASARTIRSEVVGTSPALFIYPEHVPDANLINDVQSIKVDVSGASIHLDHSNLPSNEQENEDYAKRVLKVLGNPDLYNKPQTDDDKTLSNPSPNATSGSEKDYKFGLSDCLVSGSPSVDFSNTRFGRDSSPVSVSLVTGSTTQVANVVVRPGKNYAQTARWVLAYYAANNDTYDAKKGDEVFGGAILHTVFEDVPDNHNRVLNLKWVQFTPTYFAIDRTSNNATITDHFDPVSIDKFGLLPEADFGASWHYLLSFFSFYQDDHIPKVDPAVAVTPLPKPPEPAPVPTMCPLFPTDGNSAGNQGGGYGYDSLPHPGFPTFKEDSTGVEGDIKIVLTPKEPATPFNPVPTISISGGKYFDHDYYNVTASPSWSDKLETIDPLTGQNEKITFGPEYNRQVALMGTNIKTTTGGALDFAIPEFGQIIGRGPIDLAHPDQPAPDDDHYDYSNALDLTAGAASTKNNATGPTAVDTTEYSGTAHVEQLWHFHEPITDANGKPSKWYQKSDGTQVPSTIDLECDLNEWVKPAESTQHSNYFTEGAGSFHTGGDIPAPVKYISGLDEAPEYIRTDATLSGGGIFDVAPDTDRFYGGNTPTGGSGTTLPSPIVRSFGSGKLGVYPNAGTKTAGAVDFANANLTIALPFPGLAFPFLDPDAAANVDKLLTVNSSHQAVTSNLANKDQLDYIANYEDKFSFHPIVTCDAAWLGGPANFHDRNLISIGGGGEFTFEVFNIDILYETTLHDSSHQPLSENIIAQVSYDIHF